MTLNFVDNQHVIQEKGPAVNLRIKSRQATLSDCTCFLRPGIDICMLSAPENEESLDKEVKEPVSDIVIVIISWT